MSTHQFRILCYFCCAMSAVLVGSAAARYVAQLRWLEKINTPENMALFGERWNSGAPVIISNALFVAGLFLALGACFWLKASAKSRDTASAVEETSIGE